MGLWYVAVGFVVPSIVCLFFIFGQILFDNVKYALM